MTRILRTLAVAIAAAVVTLPLSAQRRAELAPSLAVPAGAEAAAVTQPAIVQPGVMDPRLIAPEVADRGVQVRRLSEVGHVAIGAVVGAAVGVAATLAIPNCLETGSMCAMAGFAFVPVGAVVGGGVGWLVSRRR